MKIRLKRWWLPKNQEKPSEENPMEDDREEEGESPGVFRSLKKNPHPIVVIPGSFYVGNYEQATWMSGEWCVPEFEPKDLHRVMVVKTGPFSSDHDRACEIFYKLKGGKVDYGKSHSRNHRHARFGRNYEGLLPNWNERNPIHLVGQSVGATTIVKLQILLESQAFPGYKTSGKWIKSVSTVAAPLNGTTTIYILGLSEKSGVGFRFLSFLQLFSTMVHLWEWLDIQFLKKYVMDFELDHFRLSWRHRGIFKGFFSALTGRSEWSSGSDWAPYDLSIHSAIKRNAEFKLHQSVYYFSYCISQYNPRRHKITDTFLPSIKLNLWLLLLSFSMGRKKFKNPIYYGFNDCDWWENDGIVSLYSQLFPRVGVAQDPPREILFWSKDREPGKWYFQINHYDRLDFFYFSSNWERHMKMYRFLFETLRGLQPISPNMSYPSDIEDKLRLLSSSTSSLLNL